MKFVPTSCSTPASRPETCAALLLVSAFSTGRTDCRRNFVSGLFGRVAFEIRPFETAGGRQEREIAILNEDQATYLITLSRNTTKVREFKIALVKAFRRARDEIGAQKTVPLAADTPATLALRDVVAGLEMAKRFGCPESYAIQITSQHAERLTGYPVTMLANQAAACQDVPAGDVMLEPTEIGKLLDMTGADANKMLEGLGLQSKVSGVWTPTAAGQPLCIRHAWTARGKSGYNLKWNARAIEDMIADQS